MEHIVLLIFLFSFIDRGLCACDYTGQAPQRARGHGRRHEFPDSTNGNSNVLFKKLQNVKLTYSDLPKAPIPGYQIPVSIVQDSTSAQQAQLPGNSESKRELCNSTESSEANETLRFHNETEKCFPIGTQGPCGALMNFYADLSNELYGYCDCKTIDDCDKKPRVFWESTSSCYHVFDQGPCSEREWLIYDKESGKPKCVERSCPSNPTDVTDGKSWFMFNGECYQEGTQAYCEHPDERAYYFAKASGELKCSKVPPTKTCL